MSSQVNQLTEPQKPNIIPNFINVAEVARRLGKKKEWAYQRLNGWNVNGKPATFKPEEETLIRGVVKEMLIEFCEAIGIAEAQKFVGRLMDGQGESPELACIKRLVNAFSFDNGTENMPEQIAALNEAQRILNPAPPSNCKEVDMPEEPDGPDYDPEDLYYQQNADGYINDGSNNG